MEPSSRESSVDFSVQTQYVRPIANFTPWSIPPPAMFTNEFHLTDQSRPFPMITKLETLVLWLVKESMNMHVVLYLIHQTLVRCFFNSISPGGFSCIVRCMITYHDWHGDPFPFCCCLSLLWNRRDCFLIVCYRIDQARRQRLALSFHHFIIIVSSCGRAIASNITQLQLLSDYIYCPIRSSDNNNKDQNCISIDFGWSFFCFEFRLKQLKHAFSLLVLSGWHSHHDNKTSTRSR